MAEALSRPENKSTTTPDPAATVLAEKENWTSSGRSILVGTPRDLGAE